jgi:hypothetical protein
MSWTWALDAPLDDPDLAQELAGGWPDRDAAEAWLEDVFADLADAGVNQVRLLDGPTEVYAMALGGTSD